MALYRTLERLSFDSGRVVDMDAVDALEGVPQQVIQVLLALSRIAEVKTPPLRILPEWKARAETLEPLGIKNVDELVSADLDKVAEVLDTPIEGLREAVLDARQWLEVS